MHLEGVDGRRPLVIDARGVEDEQDVVAVVVELRALAELPAVLERDGVQVEQVLERPEVLVTRPEEVRPEELVAGTQGAQPLRVDGREDLHGRGR